MGLNMTLQYQLDKTAFDSLEESQQGLYKADGDNFRLSIEGMPDTSELDGLKTQVNSLMDEKKSVQRKAKEDALAAQKKAEETAKASGDFESLNASLQEKVDLIAADRDSLLAKISAGKVEAEANKIAAELADGPNAKLLSTFVAKRIRTNDKGEIEVLNNNGELVANSLQDLQKEFASNSDFNALLRGNQASGGAAKPNTSGGAAGVKEMKRDDFSAMTPLQKTEFAKSGGKIIE